MISKCGQWILDKILYPKKIIDFAQFVWTTQKIKTYDKCSLGMSSPNPGWQQSVPNPCHFSYGNARSTSEASWCESNSYHQNTHPFCSTAVIQKHIIAQGCLLFLNKIEMPVQSRGFLAESSWFIISLVKDSCLWLKII